MTLPDGARALLQKPLVVRMAVNDPNGYPHVVPVWFGLDGDDLMIFGYQNTRKIDYLQANPKGSVQIGGDNGNDGYLLKGEYSLEPDPDNQWAWKITRSGRSKNSFWCGSKSTKLSKSSRFRKQPSQSAKSRVTRSQR
jgi:general stress protein 26